MRLRIGWMSWVEFSFGITMDIHAQANDVNGISGCFKSLDNVNKRVELLDEPCRTVIIVCTAWGIIENGAFHYFFENNFDDNPEYDVFTQAFRRVGLEEIALRFSELVSLFPFTDPHKVCDKRLKFLESRPSHFLAAMDELEHLIYSFKKIDEILNTFLQASKAS